MDIKTFQRRLKAAMAITPPTDEELAARTSSQNWVGLTNREVARRVLTLYGNGSDRVKNWSPSRVKNLQAGVSVPSPGDVLILARVFGLPEEFFTLSRSELLERFASVGAPAIPGSTGHRVQEQQPSQEDRAQPENPPEEDRTDEASG